MRAPALLLVVVACCGACGRSIPTAGAPEAAPEGTRQAEQTEQTTANRGAGIERFLRLQRSPQLPGMPR